MIVDQISLSAGQRGEQENTGQRQEVEEGQTLGFFSTFDCINATLFSLPLAAAALLVRFQLIRDQMQELTFLLWKIIIKFHPNKEMPVGTGKGKSCGQG